MPRETWYILEDGSVGDPRDVSCEASGRLVHKSGVAVAVGPHGPRSRGVNTEEVAPKPAPKKIERKPKADRDVSADDDREMKAEDGVKYETR